MAMPGLANKKNVTIIPHNVCRKMRENIIILQIILPIQNVFFALPNQQKRPGAAPREKTAKQTKRAAIFFMSISSMPFP
jgi:hypothetical protein